jgi:uncharacterized membrane protein YgdD (TMEM256/DUF423 family)
MMIGKIFFLIGSMLGFLGVAFGSFGAHGLKGKVTEDLLATFEVGVRYQMYHAFALLAVAWAASQTQSGLIPWSGWCFVAGTLIFSGSLYALTLTGVKIWGAVTPIGGLFLLSGWLILILAVLKT